MSAPAIEAAHNLPRFFVSVDAGERFDAADPARTELLDRWAGAVEFAPSREERDWIARWFGWVGWLQRRRPSTTVYQTGSMVVAVTVTMALSRPVVSGNAVGLPLKSPTVAALVAQPTADPGVEIRGKGRDRHGVLPAGATSSVNGPRGRTIDDWDF
jgi:hypothetical protein